jgi:hypothetical protein
VETRPIDVRRILGEVLSLYRAHSGPLLVLAAAVFLPVAFVGALLNGVDALGAAIAAAVISGPATFLYAGMAAPVVVAHRRGRPLPEPGDMLDFAQPVIWPLLLGGLMWLTGILAGIILLIVPGLILLTIWAVVAPAIALERNSVIEAFKRSQALVRGHGWQVFGIVLLLIVLLTVMALAMQAAGEAAGGITGAFIAGWLAAVVLAPPEGLFVSILFLDLGGSPEPADRAEAERVEEARSEESDDDRDEGDGESRTGS